MVKQQSVSVETLKAIADAFNAHDLDAIMDCFADDCSLDMPRGPEPWGQRLTGKAAVRALSRQFGVSFQPIMIFPFELSDYVVLSDLSHKGFLASVERGDARPEYECLLPGHLQYSTPALEIGKGFIPILRRYPMKMLTRQMMLALATLGYPIIAAAHPGDVLLRRFVRPGASRESIHHFDTLLNFATEKCLSPSSLEQIAASLSPPLQSYSTKAPDFVRNAATHEV